MRKVISSAWKGSARSTERYGFDPSKPGQVAVRWLAAPVHHTDAAAFRASAGKVIGSDGIAIVEDSGSETTFQTGDWVIPISDNVGTWQTRSVVATKDIIAVPKVVPFEQAALVKSLLRAKRIVESVKGTDILVINGANSFISRTIAQIAKLNNIRTVGIVSSRTLQPYVENAIHRLKSFGFDAVVSDQWVGDSIFTSILEESSATLVDVVGGSEAAFQASKLRSGSRVVSIGNIHSSSNAAKVQPISAAPQELSQLLQHVKQGAIRLHLERHFYESADVAVEMVGARGRFYKPVLVFEHPKVLEPSASDLSEEQLKEDNAKWVAFQRIVKPEAEGDIATWREHLKEIADLTDFKAAHNEAKEVEFSPADFSQLEGYSYTEGPPGKTLFPRHTSSKIFTS